MEKSKTRRGIYINIEDSDITYKINNKVYKFSSYKKRDMYIKRVREAIEALNKLNTKVFRYTDIFTQKYDLNDLINGVYDKVYNNMLYK